MAGASIEFKRLLLRGVAWDAQAAGLRLRDGLKAACRARLSENKTGLSLVGAKGNGSEVTFGLPQMASRLTPETIAESVSQLYDLYEEALSELGTDEITASDDAIRERMLRLLVLNNSAAADYSQMNVIRA